MKKIPLTQNQYTLVDDDMFDELSKHKWYADKQENTFYAARNVTDNTKKGKQRVLYMHRVILSAKKGQLCDHIDRNGLNNRRSNLRVATHALNMLNQRIPKNNTSGYKGVHWFKRVNKWTAYININNKRKHLGYFDTPEKASAVYQKAFKQQMVVLTR